MTYQALARKYRPQVFSDVVGQEHVCRTLQNALRAGRIHHAYLFTGARGVGKTTVARLLARALNCQAPRMGDMLEPCGECPSCRDIAAGTSLDVQEIDGASNTGVDDVREIRERVKFLPASGKYKIYIIDEVHMLSTGAFNALLKTLEEPPAHAVFIFATTEAHKIPATILSRCQRFDFRRMSAARISETLATIAHTEGVAVSPDVLRIIAHEAAGSMRDAQSLFDQAVAFAGSELTVAHLRDMLGFLDRAQLFALLSAVIAHDSRAALDALESFFAQGADLTRLSIEMLQALRHLLVLSQCGGKTELIDAPSDEVQQLVELARRCTPEEVQQLFSIWYAGAEDIARSTTPKILCEVLILRLCAVTPVRDVAALTAAVEALLNNETSSQGTATRAAQSVAKSSPATASSLDKTAPAPSRAGGATQWAQFLEWLSKESPQVFALLGHAQLGSFEDSRVELIPESAYFHDMLVEADRRTQIDKLMHTFFQRPMHLTIARSNAPAPAAPAAAAQRERVVSDALSSPAARAAADILGAQVFDVKPAK